MVSRLVKTPYDTRSNCRYLLLSYRLFMDKLGSAFSDTLVSSTRAVFHRTSDDAPWWAGSGRVLMFATLLFVSFFILLWRLFDLTFIHGVEYRRLADGNRTRELVRHAPRGILFDRTGKPLVENIPQYRLIKPCENNATECTTHISLEEGKQLSKVGLPNGQFLEVDYQRRYTFGDAFAHLLGYTGELSQEELSSEYYSLRNYRSGDTVGRMGLEAVLNERLKGRNGKELVEVDASGAILRTLGTEAALAGEDIMLSLDSGLAVAAKNAFPVGEKGVIIVSRPQTGEILALYSSPSFSPNAFSFGMSQDEYNALVNDPDLPMFNRAIGGTYPPGSTFKIITSLAALSEKVITSTFTVEDTGVITIGPFSFPNWYFLQYGKTEGLVDIVKALQRSNDIYFYKVGEVLGITKLAAWAKKVGIGKPLGIELSGEAGGLMPDPYWKNLRFDTAFDKEQRNNDWYVGDTYHVSIGQGYLLTTPLQVNFWTNLIANGGEKCVPTLEKETRVHKKNCTPIGISRETIATVTEGMRRACDTGGTGWPLFNFGIRKLDQLDQLVKSDQFVSVPIACKTGTAEFGDPKNNTHAWFTAFGPLPAEALAKAGLPAVHSEASAKEGGSNVISGDPEISVTVLVEGAGEGSNVAAPIAKKIFEEWFGR